MAGAVAGGHPPIYGGRAQAYSTSAPAVLGQEKTRAMLDELRMSLAPYFRNGPLIEDFTNEAELYRRHGDP
jgi:hypothetical protein